MIIAGRRKPWSFRTGTALSNLYLKPMKPMNACHVHISCRPVPFAYSRSLKFPSTNFSQTHIFRAEIEVSMRQQSRYVEPRNFEPIILQMDTQTARPTELQPARGSTQMNPKICYRKVCSIVLSKVHPFRWPGRIHLSHPPRDHRGCLSTLKVSISFIIARLSIKHFLPPPPHHRLLLLMEKKVWKHTLENH